MKHAILMGDPSHFSVVGGANPHTRDRYGRKKQVDQQLAIAQWRGMRDLLSDYTLQIHVIPPDPNRPAPTRLARSGELVVWSM